MINLPKSKKIWGAFIVVFISGIMIGTASTFVLHHYIMKKVPQKPEIKMKMMMRHLDSKLNLSLKQKEQITPILDSMSLQLKTINLEQRPKINSIISDSFAKINLLLDEEQKVKMKTMKLKKYRRGGAGGRGQYQQRSKHNFNQKRSRQPQNNPPFRASKSKTPKGVSHRGREHRNP